MSDRSLLPRWLRILDMHVEDSLPFAEKLRRYITTGCSVALVLGGFGFALFNWISGGLALVPSNLVTGLGGLCGLVLVGVGSPRMAFGSITLVAGLGFFSSAIHFGNGNENFLVLGIVASMFMFDRMVSRWALSLLNGLLFLFAKLVMLAEGVESTVLPPVQYAVNLSIFLFAVMLFLELYRIVNRKYRERLEAQRCELEKHRERLEESNRAKERLFAILGHDLRGPVGNVRSVLDLLRGGQLDSEEFDDLRGSLESETANLESMLENLLEWASSQLDRIEPRPVDACLKDFIRVEIRANEAAAVRKGVRLEESVRPEFVARVDPMHLRTILRNLISNGIKFSKAGGKVLVSVGLEKDRILVSVADDGTGMNARQLDSIRSGALRESRAGTDNEKGFGLGLRICADLIRANDGVLGVESTLGKGSVFSFSLPLRKPESE